MLLTLQFTGQSPPQGATWCNMPTVLNLRNPVLYHRTVHTKSNYTETTPAKSILIIFPIPAVTGFPCHLGSPFGGVFTPLRLGDTQDSPNTLL